MGKNQIKLVVSPKDTYFGSEHVAGEIQLVIQKTINIREILLDIVGTETGMNVVMCEELFFSFIVTTFFCFRHYLLHHSLKF
jgi:hypothetical protein